MSNKPIATVSGLLRVSPLVKGVREGEARSKDLVCLVLRDLLSAEASLAGLSTFGGIMGYTMAGSVPSLAGGLGVGSVMAVAAMRIHDGLPYGYELAAASSGGLAIPMINVLALELLSCENGRFPGRLR
ncbi:hypothetical protein A1Q1_06046 [Trichosporon asahii var. asahii CBS 2479]|uniref:Uncharacterized protein n=1 Tax=Trichosporon asahii var. asahii (strain ATCC 90039 / CBS 2479 / JCM 2466 / KCTC 7840 / NBRC 103889/ NCYC 2677 / UAMH 7654) TaxID=1186058 RepID=J4U623_TRIAS|nr:hypothetical protein A1Q1_06046 [Trichosporon asahii var. asahii CBS 2479]EJT45495.1 hypothetical protein A1Q1_06046 [Trichosporon asahii var. asahii CBS 2479]